jgi:RNA polymerase sigma factor (sigma-70 family)
LEAGGKNIHQDLIERCRENDRRAQLEIYKLYYKPMFNTSLRIVNDTTEAEDVMQESFLDAFSKIDNYKGEGSFGGWLKRIVVNNSIDAIRKRKEALPLDENIYRKADETAADADYVSARTAENVEYRVEEIKKAILMLPEEHRVILSLFLFEGYDHDEIAQILKITNNASRTRFSRAKAKLLKILSDQNTIKMFNPN